MLHLSSLLNWVKGLAMDSRLCFNFWFRFWKIIILLELVTFAITIYVCISVFETFSYVFITNKCSIKLYKVATWKCNIMVMWPLVKLISSSVVTKILFWMTVEISRFLLHKEKLTFIIVFALHKFLLVKLIRNENKLIVRVHLIALINWLYSESKSA